MMKNRFIITAALALAASMALTACSACEKAASTASEVKQHLAAATADGAPYSPYEIENRYDIEGTLHYRDVLNEMGVKNQTDYVEGYGHDYKFWRQGFFNFLTKVFRK